MSVERRSPSAVADGEQSSTAVPKPSPIPQLPAELSRIIQVRHSISQPFAASFLAGGVAGAVSRTLVSPLERLKILLQVQSVGRNEYKLSISQGLKKMWREEGWKGFMRGNGSNCIRIVPYSAVQFSSYGFYKRVSINAKQSKLIMCTEHLTDTYFLQHLETSPGAGLPPLQGLLCGACAGITAVGFTYPLDIVRTRLSIQSASFASLTETQRKKLPGMWGTLKYMYKTEGGFPALYRGILPTIAGVAPYASLLVPKFRVIADNVKVGLNFMTYEFVRQYLTPEGDKDPSPWRKLAAGAISGGFAQTCTYPLYAHDPLSRPRILLIRG